MMSGRGIDPVKVLHVSASYLPATRYGGTIVSVHGLCQALARRGHDVHVYTTSVDGHRNSPVPHGVPVDIGGVKVWYFESSAARRLYYAPALASALRAHVHEFAVVHTHAIYLWPLWTAARHARRAGVPYVVSPRGMLEKELIEQKSVLWKAALIGFFERRTLEHAAAIHVTSRREADEARAFGFDLPAMCEIPNGVDADQTTATGISAPIGAILAGGPYALYLGRINWKKGLDRLLRALTYAPQVRVVLAGNDEEGYRHVLEPLASAHGVAGRVLFTGHVGGADKTALLNHADFLVLPSYSENFGNVVLEAMLAGRAVLVTPEVGVAAVVRDAHAGVVAEGDPVSLGGMMARLAADPALRETLGANGRALAATRFTWDVVAAQMETLYSRIASGRSAC
jgi:glycosyltransferase involved in cell wall biosynthesis